MNVHIVIYEREGITQVYELLCSTAQIFCMNLYHIAPWPINNISITDNKLCWQIQGEVCPFGCASHQSNILDSLSIWRRECCSDFQESLVELHNLKLIIHNSDYIYINLLVKVFCFQFWLCWWWSGLVGLLWFVFYHWKL